MNIESANTQHPVPQNVMDVEFKLVGDLTIRQFSYLLIFSILIFLVYSIHLPFIFSYPIMAILLLMGLGFAFVPLNDISLDKWAVNYVRAITNPRIRVWKHKNRMPYYLTFEATSQRKVGKNYGVQILGNTRKKSLEELLSASDMHNQITVAFEDTSDIDLKEKEFIEKIGLKSIHSKEVVNDEIVFVRENLQQDELEDKNNFSNVVTKNFSETNVNNRQEENYQKHLKDLEELKKKVTKEVEKIDTRNEIKNKIQEAIYEKQETRDLPAQSGEKINIEIEDKKILDEKLDIKTKDERTGEKKQEEKIETPKPKSSIFADLFEKLTTPNNKKVVIKQDAKENLVAITQGVQDVETIRENIKKQNNANSNQFLLKGQTAEASGKIIQDVIVIVKNKGGEPLRAIKSNSLGIFDSVTPLLLDEEYILEGDKQNYIFEPLVLKASLKQENLVKLIGRPAI
ncbi:PrgI family protein [Patescibacteria group bacterium]|nr:PrgI family protein [Patescibacteria group bacterium]